MSYVPPHKRRQQQAGVKQPSTKNDNLTTKTATKGTKGLQQRRQWSDDDTDKTKEKEDGDDGDGDDGILTLCNAFQRIYVINLIHRQDRWGSFLVRLKKTMFGLPYHDHDHDHDHRQRHRSLLQTLFIDKIQRFDAVDGRQLVEEIRVDETNNNENLSDYVRMDWDATINAQYDHHIQPPMKKQLSSGEVGCAMSHIKLWELATTALENLHDSMLVLEDDAVFFHKVPSSSSSSASSMSSSKNNKQHDKDKCISFVQVFSEAWSKLPENWDIFYLGFSDRGERILIDSTNNITTTTSTDLVMLFRPTYGFHTHAYAITKRGAIKLLDQLPVVGPLDVWLADNQWFDMNVYCAMVKNEGWKGTGACLLSQHKHNMKSDINQSGRF